jgi:hypothetical protein
MWRYPQKRGGLVAGRKMSSGVPFRSTHRAHDSVCSIDLDLPIDCDDDYWDLSDPNLAFHQPEGTPSRMSYFLHTIKLRMINLRAMRRVVRLCSKL